MWSFKLNNNSECFQSTLDYSNETCSYATLTNINSFLNENSNSSTDSNETHEFKFNYFLVDNKFDKIKEEVFSSSDSQHTDDCARTVTKKRRTRFTSSQTEKLETYFATVSQYPTSSIIDSFADSFRLPTNTIVYWFQNRRARNKKLIKKEK